MPPDAGIQETCRTLAVDDPRRASLAEEIVDAYLQGRKILALTERTGHLAVIEAALGGRAGFKPGQSSGDLERGRLQ